MLDIASRLFCDAVGHVVPGGGSIAETYVFPIRPVADSPDGLPKAWWLPGALGPLAILEASKDGLRIIRPSVRGRALQGLVVSAIGIAMMIGVWAPTAFLITRGLGVGIGSALLGFFLAGLLVIGIAILLSPHIRALVAWRPQSRFVRVNVVTVSLGRFRQELQIEGEGHEVRVRTSARLATITAALRLAHQMPPESEVFG